MGWSFTHGASKQDIVADLTKTWESDTIRSETIAKSLNGNRLWFVVEHTSKVDGTKSRFIALSLLACDRSYGYGSKDMSEDCGPCYYDCPLKFLDMAPPSDSQFAEGWRDKVREHHASRRTQRKRKVEEGKTYQLLRTAKEYGDRVEITQVRVSTRRGRTKREFVGFIPAVHRELLIPRTRIGDEITA